MNLHAPVSLALLHDLRVRPLPWAERGVLHHISLVAGISEDGATVHIDHRASEADVAAWTRALGAEGALLVGRLVEMGLLLIVPEGLRLVFVAKGAAAPAEAPPREAPADFQGKPSTHPAAVRLREDRSRFGRRVKGWARIPAGVTWDAWLATDDGRAFVAARDEDFPGYLVRAIEGGSHRVTPRDPSGVTPQGHTGGHTPGSHPLAGASESQIPPSFQGNSESREEKKGIQTREGHAGVTPQGHTGGHTPGSHPSAHALDALRDASGGHATLSGATALEREAAEVLSRHALTETDLARAAAAFADPSAWWPRGKNPAPRHVTLNDLAGFRGEQGYEWRALAALVAHLRLRKRPKPQSPVSAPEAPVAPLPPQPRRATGADARRARAEIFAPLAPPALPDSPETTDAR